MVLQTAGRSRERVLVFGVEGTGKSLCLLDIAARVHPRRVWIIDNDNAWDRMLEGQTLAGEDVAVAEEWRWDASLRHRDADGKWVDGDWVADDRFVQAEGNVVVFHVDGWVAQTQAIREVQQRADVDDWCGVDSGSALWDDVQEWYTNSVFSQSMDDYFMQVRMEKEAAARESKSLGALDGWLDWPVVNAQYKTKVMKFLVTPPCHLFLTAEQATIDMKEEKDKEVIALYGGQQVKPRGQKRIGHNMQTVLSLRRGANDYTVKTVKDRGGREKLDRADVTGVGFSDWYLRDVAHWVETTEASAAPTPKKIIVKKG